MPAVSMGLSAHSLDCGAPFSLHQRSAQPDPNLLTYRR
jgi:hypothetical protein